MGARDGDGKPDDMKKDNNIRVTLDFVPVTEQWPREGEEYVCLLANDHSMKTGHRCICELYWTGDEWRDYEEDTPLSNGWFVTHFAERPGKIAEIG